MMPILPFKHRAGPLLFLAVIGGAIAAIDTWMHGRLPDNPGAKPARRTSRKPRRAPVARRRRAPAGA